MKLGSLCLCGFALLTLIGDVRAQSRTWTDHSGKAIFAKFTRLAKGRVTLESGGRRMTVPFWSLCTDDQKYLRQHLTILGKGRDVPDVAEAPRSWTDTGGNRVTAQFIKVVDRQIVLVMGDKVSRFPFLNFSEADQDYVRGLLAARGQEDLVPPKPEEPAQPKIESPNVSGTNSPAVSTQPRPGISSPSIPKLPTAPVHEQPQTQSIPMPTPPPTPPPSRSVTSTMPSRPSVSRPPSSSQPRFPTSPPAFPRRTSPGAPPGFRGHMPSRGGAAGGDIVYYCTGCNKEVSASAKDRCPHCGGYWDYMENPDGTRTTTARGRRSNIRMIRGIVVLVLLAAGAIWKFANR